MFEIDKRFNANRADFLIWAIPDTTVQKMIGAVNIVVSLMKPSPRALTKSLVASDGHSQPNDDANQDRNQHLNVKDLVQGSRRPRGLCSCDCRHDALSHTHAGI